ncbi:hypothetical protein CANARDRAFT_201313 [[Candida] arabinofermentans NRRL YB-2248]|uniref:Probable metalloreductase AIM14 n=1 Tax=[Candida] arabinofermentans NRRL YB-2248 TaxID=983967 RepID=A0A1E4SXV4_9ASCO|nr:hypothetical protein CANARDRAFT_201313 [[Candida] arabinofermentans NRRL YB-2248]
MSSASASFIDVIKRHGSTHYINVKYGYFTIFLTICYLVYREVALYYYNRSWSRSGRSTTRLGLVTFPLLYLISIIAFVVLIMEVFNPHLDKLTIHFKRAGRLAYSLLPLDLVLALRPSPFKLDNYLDTLIVHKWISRIILILGISHSIGFMLRWYDVGTFSKTWDIVNLAGFIMFTLFSILLVINWKKIRSSIYKYFYVVHNVTLWSFVLMTWYHARPGVTPIAIVCISILIFQFAVKFMTLQDVQIVDTISNDGSDLMIVKMPKRLLPDGYLPGCHLRLGYSWKSPLYWVFPSHPYTIATTFEEPGSQISLVLRKSTFKVFSNKTYSIQPYFKSSLGLNFFQTAENISIVCGGSGISLGLVLANYFKKKILEDLKDIKISFIWITPSREDLFVLKALRVEGVEVYITGSKTTEFASSSQTLQTETALSTSFDDVPISESDNPFSDTYELESLENRNGYNIDEDHEDGESLNDPDGLQTKFRNKYHYGKRPQLSQVLERHLDKTIDYANKWIIACGPPALNKDCKAIAETSRCRFFSEEYSM